MSAAPRINPKDLPASVKRRLGVKEGPTFSKEAVRSWALKILAELAELTQAQRERVLEHARKVNRI